MIPAINPIGESIEIPIGLILLYKQNDKISISNIFHDVTNFSRELPNIGLGESKKAADALLRMEMTFPPQK